MEWNYRVMHDDGYYTLREVYYEDDKIVGWTDDATPGGVDVEELKQDLEYMLRALKHPVLDEAELTKNHP